MPMIKVRQKEVAAYFNMNQSITSQHIRNGNRLDYVYIVFSRQELSDAQKEDYLIRTSLSEYMKKKLWAIYQERVS